MTLTATRRRPLEELHSEHETWAKEVAFYKDELKIFNKRLEEMSSRTIGIDLRIQIEHFQNQFNIQKGQLEILNHDIKIHEQWLAGYAKEHEKTIEKELFADHAVMKDNVKTFRKIFSELKTEYYKFLEKWKF